VPGAGDVPETKGCLHSFALLKNKYSKLRVILSVGGGGKGSEPFAEVARHQGTREKFAQTALALVQQFGIDGIDSKLIVLYRIIGANRMVSRLGASVRLETR
jgi:chitinase